MRRITLTLSLLALAVAAAACATTAESVTRLDGAPTSVVVDIIAGNVTVGTAGRAGQVEVSATIDGDAAPSIDLSGDTLTVSDDCAEEGCRIDYVISLPDGADLTVTTAAGNIVVRDNSGDLSLATGDGGISLFTSEGDIEASTETGDLVGTRLTAARAWFTAGSGTIDVSFDSPVTDLSAATGAGNVTVQLDASAPYAIVADAPGRVDLGVDSDDSAANQVALTTADGDIRVYRQ